jgi:aminoglycoside 3'-phosphotransferase-2
MISMPEPQPLSSLPVSLPTDWQALLAPYRWRAQTEGCSDAAVFRLESVGQNTLFLKTERMHAHAELADEAARLRWLAAQGLACPAVMASHFQSERGWLLLSAVAGNNIYSSALPAAQAVPLIAHALKALHQVTDANCPFDHSAAVRITHAQARLQAGLVLLDDVDEENQGLTAEQIFQKLVSLQPKSEDMVVTHGDACLPNFMAENGTFTGYIDCGRLGVADRYQDIALALRDIRADFGSAYVPLFMEHYGLATLDEQRIAFYTLLDEFF